MMIYPTDKKKYCGGLSKTKYNTWQVNIRHSDVRICKNFATEALGFEFMKTKNIEHNLPIKNMITKHEDHYSVNLTQGKEMKFDECDLDLIQPHTLSNNSGYAITYAEERLHKFHNLIMNHTPGDLTVDHINQDRSDNRRANLRIVDRRIQGTNQRIRTTNTSGIVGVSKSTGLCPQWIASWANESGKQKNKSFSIKKYGDSKAKQMAIDYRAQAISPLAHYD